MKNNRKAVEERHLKILNMIRERGEVKVEELAELFQISPMTVRRDMQYLEEEKLISRIHGGAVSLEKANMLLSQDEKISLCRERISEYASRFIDDGELNDWLRRDPWDYHGADFENHTCAKGSSILDYSL